MQKHISISTYVLKFSPARCTSSLHLLTHSLCHSYTEMWINNARAADNTNQIAANNLHRRSAGSASVVWHQCNTRRRRNSTRHSNIYMVRQCVSAHEQPTHTRFDTFVATLNVSH